jgi:hypothetical protein
MKAITKTLLGWSMVVLVASVGVYLLAFYVYPSLSVMRDHAMALKYSRVLSQVKVEDLTTLSIPQPSPSRPISQSEIRKLLQHLHDNQLFPEWKPDFKLQDSKGVPFEFSIQTYDPDESIHTYTGYRQGDFIFGVKPSTLPHAVLGL